MRYSITLILFLSWSALLFSQDSTFMDSRDGTTYKIVEIENLYWISSNIKYKTYNSYCFENPTDIKCNDNNYYYYSELDSVCPVGWRLPTWEEWQKSVYSYADKNKIHYDSIRVDSSSSNLNIFSVTISGINLYDDTLRFNLKSAGMVEGNYTEKEKKLVKYPAATFWIEEPLTKDSTTHVHIGTTKYVKHAHSHHIIDKPKRTRRFTVRCVKEKHVLTEPKTN
jgi:uncharacterized protein (TIGR02145 family)